MILPFPFLQPDPDYFPVRFFDHPTLYFIYPELHQLLVYVPENLPLLVIVPELLPVPLSVLVPELPTAPFSGLVLPLLSVPVLSTEGCLF